MKNGFTLLELLIVISLVGVVGASILFLVNPNEQVKKTNDTKRKSELTGFRNALELYYNDFGSYPGTSGSPDYKIVANSTEINWGSSWLPYAGQVPNDPSSTNKYVYYAPADGQSYYIFANLERGAKDPQACNGGNACTSLSQVGFPPIMSCGGVCNYGVSSSNTNL